MGMTAVAVRERHCFVPALEEHPLLVNLPSSRIHWQAQAATYTTMKVAPKKGC